MFTLCGQIFSSFQCIIWIALALIAVIPVVVSPFPPLDDIRLIISQAFGVLDLNGMFLSPSLFSFHARVRTEADSSLCYWTDVWNDVRFITSLSLLVSG